TQMDVARASRKTKVKQADGLLAGLDGFLLRLLGIAPPRSDDRNVFAICRSQVEREDRFNPDYFHPERTLALRTLEQSAAHLNLRPLGNVVEFVRDQIKVPDRKYLSLANVQSNTGELVEIDE